MIECQRGSPAIQGGEGSGKKLKLEQRAGLIHRPAVD